MHVPKITQCNKSIKISDETKLCIREKNRIKRKLQRSQNPSEKIILKSIVNQLSNLIRQNVFLDRNRNWSEMLSKLKTGDDKFWKITKFQRGKGHNNIGNIIANGTVIYSNTEKANAIADAFEKSHNLTSNWVSRKENIVSRAICKLERRTPNDDPTTHTTNIEIKNILRSIKYSKAPGLDNVSNILLKNLPSSALQFIEKIFNYSIQLCYFPLAFKIAKVVPIHKQGKNKQIPSSYRPISLLSNIGKIFERIIHTRLNSFVEEHQVLPIEQFGFRQHHSTTHQVCRVSNMIKRNKRRRKSTGMLLLDIEKAFDSVWHKGLVYKLMKFAVPDYLCKLIKSFLSERKFKTSVNGSISSARDIPAGVPQGSVLSPLLYTLFTSDVKVPRGTEMALYADDTALIIEGKVTSAIINKMEKSISSLTKYYKNWKIKCNHEKYQAIIFPFNRSRKRHPRRNLICNNSNITFTNSVKYLGVTFDKHLLFHKHIDTIVQKASTCLKSLYGLIHRKSKLSTKNQLLCFKGILRPIMVYAAPLWYKASKTNIKKLQVIQNKTLKLIFNLPIRYSTHELHDEYNLDMFQNYIKKLADNFKSNCRSSQYRLINDLAN